MNGPQHYAESERLLTLAGNVADLTTDNGVLINTGDLLIASQVHATLALVAAIANTEVGDMHPMAERPRAGNPPTWSQVLA